MASFSRKTFEGGVDRWLQFPDEFRVSDSPDMPVGYLLATVHVGYDDMVSTYFSR